MTTLNMQITVHLGNYRYKSRRSRLSEFNASLNWNIYSQKYILKLYLDIFFVCVFRVFCLLNKIQQCAIVIRALWPDSLLPTAENCQDSFINYNNVYHKGYRTVLFICVITHGLTRNNRGLIMQTAVHSMQMNIKNPQTPE